MRSALLTRGLTYVDRCLGSFDSLTRHKLGAVLALRVRLVAVAAQTSDVPQSTTAMELLREHGQLKSLRSAHVAADLYSVARADLTKWRSVQRGFDVDELRAVDEALSLTLEVGRAEERVRRELTLAQTKKSLGETASAAMHAEHARRIERGVRNPDPSLLFRIRREMAYIAVVDDKARAIRLAEEALSEVDHRTVTETSILALEVEVIFFTWFDRNARQPCDAEGRPEQLANEDLGQRIEALRSRYLELDLETCSDALHLEFYYCLVLLGAWRYDELRDHIRWLVPLLKRDASPVSRVQLDRLHQMASWFDVEMESDEVLNN